MDRRASLLLLAVLHSSAADLPAPTADEIVARMMAAGDARTSKLGEYTSVRHYSLDNKRFGVRAAMTARVGYRFPGVKTYEILEQSGPGAIRSRVFKRMLDTEVQASEGAGRQDTRMSPENYEFRLLGSQVYDGRPCYELDVTPRTTNALLFRGKICVDAEDYAVVRMDGEPARNPSFWLRKTVITHRYAKFGSFWLPVSNESASDVKIFGTTLVRIEYTGYQIGAREADPPPEK